MLASYNGHAETTRLLLEHGTDTARTLTPLIFAAMFGRAKVVEQLKAHGTSLQQRNRLGISAKWMVWISRCLSRRFRCHQPETA
jgi:ankyrin repeat protein